MINLRENIQAVRTKIGLFKTHLTFNVPDNRIALDPILELNSNEIFVFGSNLRGDHGGGAARYAKDNFGAKQGDAVGRTGKCWAIPTLGIHHEKLSLGYIEKHVTDLLIYAVLKPEMDIMVSAIGCGIAGFTPEEIAPMFRDAVKLPNVKLPLIFWKVLLNK